MKTKAATMILAPVMLIYGAAVTTAGVADFTDVRQVATSLLPASGVLLLCLLAQDFIPRWLKEMLVFWRFDNRLPGHRAYDGRLDSDARISIDYMNSQRSKIEDQGLEPNACWYGEYQLHRDVGGVSDANFRYIAWRDATSVAAVLALLTPTLWLFDMIPTNSMIWITAACLAFSLASIVSARSAANRLVSNVLAVASAKHKGV